jgi:hypothetical protein
VTAADQRFAGFAYGLEISSAFRLPGLGPEEGSPSGFGEVTRIEFAPAGALRDSAGRSRISTKRDPQGRVATTIDLETTGDVYFHARGHGHFRLASDASLIECAPAPIAPWRWQRYLAAQVLPFASLLRGFEVFHAAAVEIDGKAVAFLGSSGAGKSTIALNLHLGGAGLIADDVLAVEAGSDRALAHPGLGAVKVRPGAVDLLDKRAVVSDEGVIGRGDDEVILSARVAGTPAPLEALCFLSVDPAARTPRSSASRRPTRRCSCRRPSTSSSIRRHGS